ncbi:MAG: hypothetical protein V4597_08345 [Pseudomonadota bacterium]
MTRTTTTTLIGGTGALAGILLAATLLRPPAAPDPAILALQARVDGLVREFAALEVERFVPPAPGAPIDRYTLELDSGAHKLEDTDVALLSVPLYDLAVARTPVQRAAAGVHVQYGLRAVRAVLDNDLGRGQDEWNEADVLARLRLALVDVEALPGVRRRPE